MARALRSGVHSSSCLALMLPCGVSSRVATLGRPPCVTGQPLGSPGHLGRSLVCAAAKKQKPQTKKVRKPKQPEQRRIRYAQDLQDAADWEDEPDGPAGDKVLVVGAPSSSLPAAPPPTSVSSGPKAPRPEDLYPVFKQEQVVTPLSPSSTSTSSSRGSSSSSSSSSSSGGSPGGKWSWDEPAAGSIITDDVPLWNPRTGFTQPPQESDSAPSSSTSSSSPVQPDVVLPSAASPGPASSSGQAEELPAVSKSQVLSSCFSTSAGMVLFGFLLRTYAEQNAAAAMGTDPLLLQQLLRVPGGLESWQNMGWMLGAAAGVTGARLLLLSQWEEFREATNRSNKQVLTPLSWGDIAVVSLLTGVSEEFLFRSGLIPASFPDWRGAVAAGLVFGLLHNSGGRNLAFAAWASVVGVVYGAAFLATSNIWVPAGAHVLANFASAAAWRLRLVRRD